MAFAAPPSHGWTYDRYLELDDEQRYEIIDGELLLTPAQGTRHQALLTELGCRVIQHVKERKLGDIFLAPTDVVLSDTNVVQPDILFISAGRAAELIDPRAVRGAPDLAVEILSPYSILRDRHRKHALYQRSGIREFWLVDPANRAVEVFSLGENGYELTSFAAETGRVESRVLDGFSVAVEEIMPPG